MYKPLTQNIRVGCLVWYLDERIIPGISHKLRSFWAGSYRVSKLIAPSLAEIKPVYYPGEEKLVNLDVLKLYHGEDVVRQNPEDIDPDKWTDEVELTKLPEIPRREPERVYMETGLDAKSPEIPIEREPEQYLQVTQEDIAEREGIHKRTQSEMCNDDKEAISRAEEMLELPPVWNKVQDIILDDVDMLPVDLRLEKRKRVEISRGRRKQRNEEDIRPDKREHSLTESRRIHHPQGFFGEDWNEDQQEENDYQTPDKFQRISNMVFLNGVQEVPPVKDGVLSSPCVQHQGGRCSVSDVCGHVH